MADPFKIIIDQQNIIAPTIQQEILYVGKEDGKLMTIRQIISNGFKPPMLVFV